MLGPFFKVVRRKLAKSSRYIESLFFSSSGSPDHCDKARLGLNELIYRKSHWVAIQREKFPAFRVQIAEGLITSAQLKSSLADLASTLGPKLGSPAVMLCELEVLKSQHINPEYSTIIEEVQIDISAALYHDPHAAYANLLADINLLLEMDLVFINSSEGRQWLAAYRQFFSSAVFDQALSKIAHHADTQFVELLREMHTPTESLARAKALIDQFEQWRIAQRLQERKPPSRTVMMRLLQLQAPLESKQRKRTPIRPSIVKDGLFRATLSRLASPLKFLSTHKFLSGGLILAIRTVAVLANENKSADSGIDNVLLDLNFELRSAMGTLAIIDDAQLRIDRHLQTNNQFCQSNLIFPETDASWMASLGGTDSDLGFDVASKPDGSSVLVGYTTSFAAGEEDILVAQFARSGQLDWAKRLGGVGVDWASATAVTSDGTVLVAGYTENLPGNTGPSPADVILAQFDPKGELAAAVTMGGPGADRATGLAIAPDGSIAVLGYTTSLSVGDVDIFVAKLTPSGQLSWARGIGTPLFDEARGIAVNDDGNIVIAGRTLGGGAGDWDILLAEIDSNGDFQWAKSLGGPGVDEARKLTMDSNGDYVVVGYTDSVGAGSKDCLIAKFSAVGDLVWSHLLGGAGWDEANSVAIKSDGRIVTVGRTESVGAGDSDILVAEFHANGQLAWTKTLGGNGGDSGQGVALSQDESIVLAGLSFSVGLGNSDTLIARLNSNNTITNIVSSLQLEEAQLTFGNASSLLLSEATPLFTTFSPLIQAVSTTIFSPIQLNTIPEGVVTRLSAQPNVAVWPKPSNAAKMFSWQYTLPLLPYQFLVVQPDIQVDTLGSDWLSYDFASRTISGTAITEPVGIVNVRLIPSSVFVPGAGVFGFSEVTLQLCIGGEAQPGFLATEGKSTSDAGFSVAVKTDGSFVVTGYSEVIEQAGARVRDALLMQYSATGSKAWGKRIGGIQSDQGNAVTLTPEGDIVVVGETSSSASSSDVLVGHFSPSGSLNWLKSLAGSGRYFCKSVAIKSDSSLIIAGSHENSSSGKFDIFIAQMSSSGQLEWANTYGGIGDDYGHAVSVTDSGEIYVAGSAGEVLGNKRAILIKFAFGGNELWAKRIETGLQSEWYDVKIKPDQSVICVGHISIGQNNDELLVAAFAPSGQLHWARVIKGTSDEIGYSVATKPDGSVVVVGSTNSYGSGGEEIILAELDHNGDLRWANVLGGGKSDVGYGVATQSNGAAVLVGSTESFGVGDDDMLLAQIDNQGRLAIPGGSSFQSPIVSPVLADNPWLDLVDASTSMTLNNALGSISVITPAQSFVSDIDDSVSFDITYLKANALAPVTNQAFGELYYLDLNTILSDDVLVGRIARTGTPFLPSWLSYDISTRVLSGLPIGNVRGKYFITMDLQMSGQSQEVTFVLNVTNTVPYLTEMPVYNSTVGRFVVSLSEKFVDDEGDVVSAFSIAQINNELAPTIGSIDQLTGRLFGTTLSGDQGVYQFNVTASDLYDVGWQIVTLNVVNSPPVVQFLFEDPLPVTIGTRFSYSFPANAFTDPDGDLVSYSVSDLPSFLSFSASSRSLIGVPQSQDRGTYQIPIYAQDAYQGRANATITISVNAPPEIRLPIHNLVTSDVGQVYYYQFPTNLHFDLDHDPITYQLVEDIQHIKPAWLTFDPVSRRLSGVPDANNHQVTQIRFMVSDGRGGEVAYDINLQTPNSAPRIMRGFANQISPVDQVKSVIISDDTFIDVDGDALTFSLELASAEPQSWASLAGNVLIFAPKSGDQGNYNFRLFARDAYGGEISSQFTATVPNRAPRLAYNIPVPDAAFAGQRWTYELDADNFNDEDKDVLTYTASLLNGTTIPNWMAFNPARRSFSGIPKGVDRGTLALRVQVNDGHGGVEDGVFNVTILNTVPQPAERIFDQQASNLDSLVTFTIPAFVDADRDDIVYQARMHDGSPLPAWILFDQAARRFSTNPSQAEPGNYVLSVIATDSSGGSHEESFNLAIQAAPELDQNDSSTREIVQIILPMLLGLSLFFSVAATLAWRTQRITKMNRAIRRWAEEKSTNTVPTMRIPFSTLRDSLVDIMTEINGNTPLDEIEKLLLQFGSQLKHYYAQKGEKLALMTRLLSLSIVETLIQFVNANVLEAENDHTADSDTLDATRLLHYFLGLILSEHTGRHHRLTREIKAAYFSMLDNLIIRLPTKSKQDIDILYELECCREAVVNMTDTNTILQVCKVSLSHTLSPGALLSDLKTLVFDIPSTWYVTLLEMNQSIPRAQASMSSLLMLQSNAATETDWRFRFGMTSVLLSIITGTADDAIRLQAIKGGMRFRRLKFLGFKHLLQAKQSKLCRWRNTWVGKQARWALNEASDQLSMLARIELRDYLTPTLPRKHSRSRRVSLIATPLESQRIARPSVSLGQGTSAMAPSAGSGASWCSNPMLSSQAAGGRSRIQSWTGRAAVRVTKRPLRVREPSIAEEEAKRPSAR